MAVGTNSVSAEDELVEDKFFLNFNPKPPLTGSPQNKRPDFLKRGSMKGAALIHTKGMIDSFTQKIIQPKIAQPLGRIDSIRQEEEAPLQSSNDQLGEEEDGTSENGSPEVATEKVATLQDEVENGKEMDDDEGREDTPKTEANTDDPKNSAPPHVRKGAHGFFRIESAIDANEEPSQNSAGSPSKTIGTPNEKEGGGKPKTLDESTPNSQDSPKSPQAAGESAHETADGDDDARRTQKKRRASVKHTTPKFFKQKTRESMFGSPKVGNKTRESVLHDVEMSRSPVLRRASVFKKPIKDLDFSSAEAAAAGVLTQKEMERAVLYHGKAGAEKVKEELEERRRKAFVAEAQKQVQRRMKKAATKEVVDKDEEAKTMKWLGLDGGEPTVAERRAFYRDARLARMSIANSNKEEGGAEDETNDDGKVSALSVFKRAAQSVQKAGRTMGGKTVLQKWLQELKEGGHEDFRQMGESDLEIETERYEKSKEKRYTPLPFANLVDERIQKYKVNESSDRIAKMVHALVQRIESRSGRKTRTAVGSFADDIEDLLFGFRKVEAKIIEFKMRPVATQKKYFEDGRVGKVSKGILLVDGRIRAMRMMLSLAATGILMGNSRRSSESPEQVEDEQAFGESNRTLQFQFDSDTSSDDGCEELSPSQNNSARQVGRKKSMAKGTVFAAIERDLCDRGLNMFRALIADVALLKDQPELAVFLGDDPEDRRDAGAETEIPKESDEIEKVFFEVDVFLGKLVANAGMAKLNFLNELTRSLLDQLAAAGEKRICAEHIEWEMGGSEHENSITVSCSVSPPDGFSALAAKTALEGCRWFDPVPKAVVRFLLGQIAKNLVRGRRQRTVDLSSVNLDDVDGVFTRLTSDGKDCNLKVAATQWPEIYKDRRAALRAVRDANDNLLFQLDQLVKDMGKGMGRTGGDEQPRSNSLVLQTRQALAEVLETHDFVSRSRRRSSGNTHNDDSSSVQRCHVVQKKLKSAINLVMNATSTSANLRQLMGGSVSSASPIHGTCADAVEETNKAPFSGDKGQEKKLSFLAFANPDTDNGKKQSFLALEVESDNLWEEKLNSMKQSLSELLPTDALANFGAPMRESLIELFPTDDDLAPAEHPPSEDAITPEVTQTSLTPEQTVEDTQPMDPLDLWWANVCRFRYAGCGDIQEEGHAHVSGDVWMGRAKSGHVYYYDASTKASSWTPPWEKKIVDSRSTASRYAFSLACANQPLEELPRIPARGWNTSGCGRGGFATPTSKVPLALSQRVGKSMGAAGDGRASPNASNGRAQVSQPSARGPVAGSPKMSPAEGLSVSQLSQSPTRLSTAEGGRSRRRLAPQRPASCCGGGLMYLL